MDFNIHNPAGVWVGIVENPTSAIWTRRYQKPDDFELYLPATAETLALIYEGCYITRTDISGVMIVEHVEIATSSEEGNFLLISGRGAESLLDRRIVYEQTILSGRVDAAIYRLIDENAIRPANSARRLPLSMDEPDVSSDTIKAQHTGTNLLEAVEEICTAYGLGFRAVADNAGEITPRIELFKGTDRSAGQSVNSPVTFSAEFENLLSSSYAMDTSAYKNVAIVAGEGEGKNRKRATVGSAEGIDRREIYVDARDLSSNEGEVSELDYTAQLQARGVEILADSAITEAFEGEIDTSNTFILDADYTLGDIVTTANEYGIQADTRIMAIMESWDESGYTAVPTFSSEGG